MALHSQFNEPNKYRTACGLPLIPIRTKFEGPGSLGFAPNSPEDIIDEAFKVFRVNVLFKNFEIRGPGDKVLIYLLVLISHLFKSTEQMYPFADCSKEPAQVQKKLGEINSLPTPLPKEKANFLCNLLEDGSGPERQAYLDYLKQLRAETINRFLNRYAKCELGFTDRTGSRWRTTSSGADWPGRSSWDSTSSACSEQMITRNATMQHFHPTPILSIMAFNPSYCSPLFSPFSSNTPDQQNQLLFAWLVPESSLAPVSPPSDFNFACSGVQYCVLGQSAREALVIIAISKNIQMQMLPLLLLFLQTAAIIIPVHTGEERCMALYSLSHQDSVKVSVKFPQDPSIEKFYDYITEIRDLNGNLIVRSLPLNHITRTEILVPNETIYQACIRITFNSSKSSNHSQKYYGQILVEYEANTHFITDELNAPVIENALKESEVLALQKQAAQVIDATKEYIRLQAVEKELEMREFSERREIEDSLFEWWMLELLLIVSLGLYQWNRMKRKLEGEML